MTAPHDSPTAQGGGLARDSHAALLLVLTWAVWVGAVLAPRGAAGVAVLAPRSGVAGGTVHLPPDVRSALAAEWREVRAALDASHAALAQRDFAGWPAVRPELLTVVAWADVVRAGFDADAAEWWDERAGIYEADARAPRWYAECQAAEDVARRRMTRPPASSTTPRIPQDFDKSVPAERADGPAYQEGPWAA